jgi:hypothetical protein
MREDSGRCNFKRGPGADYSLFMILIILLIVLALVTGVLGALIKGAFWLFIFTVVFLIGAFVVGRKSRA